jgi:hypothetical protein
VEAEERSLKSDLLRWLDDARRCSVKAFAAEHKGLYFLTEMVAMPDSMPLDFETNLPPHTPKVSTVIAPRTPQVIPIAKSARSPYKDRISIGRARNCDIVIRHSSVSKLHAHIRLSEDGSLKLVDLDSYNGTLLNARELVPNVPEPLRAGDVVVFGSITARTMDAVDLYKALMRSHVPQSGSAGRR